MSDHTPPTPDQSPRAGQGTPSIVRSTGHSHALGSPSGGRPEDRLRRLVHEIGNLIDGSQRCVNAALGSVQRGLLDDDVAGRLRVVRAALSRMSDVLRWESGAPASAAARLLLAADTSPNNPAAPTLGEAVCYAVEIISPLAERAKVGVVVDLDRAAAAGPAGPAYVLIVNALRNAIESILNAGLGHTGSGGVWINVSTAHDRVTFDIQDNGGGPPMDADPFADGFTTKPGGLGIGLKVCREAVLAARGRIELSPRPDGPGALLHASWPRSV